MRETYINQGFSKKYIYIHVNPCPISYVSKLTQKTFHRKINHTRQMMTFVIMIMLMLFEDGWFPSDLGKTGSCQARAAWALVFFAVEHCQVLPLYVHKGHWTCVPAPQLKEPHKVRNPT